MAINIIFNNKRIPEFIKVTNIEEQILPKANGNTFESLVTINFDINKKGLIENDKKIEFVDWLEGDEFKESKLSLPNNLGQYYIAKVNNTIDISGGFRRGSGTIEFLCTSPSIEYYKNKVSFSTEKTIYYRGTLVCNPIIKIEVISQIQEIKIVVENNKFNNYICLVGNFNKDTIIEIDMKKAKVMMNNKLNMQILSLDSKFHKIVPGSNRYIVSTDKVSVTLEWQNQYT